MIGNLSGLKAVVLLWRFGPLVRDARAICGTRSSRVTSLSSLYEGKSQLTISKNSKATNPSKTDTNLPSDCTEKKRTTVCRGKRTLFLHLQLILAFISSKYVFPYKVYKSYTELGLPVVSHAPPSCCKSSKNLAGLLIVDWKLMSSP